MSSQSWRKNTSVVKNLMEHPYMFDFSQAVRLLERSTAFRVTQADKATDNPVGKYMRPQSEFVRFSSRQSFSFPSSEMFSVKVNLKDAKVDQWQMSINFIGLAGCSGVLPYHYTETALKRLKLKDSTMVKFFDLFNHRIASLFYQASNKYNFTISYERNALRNNAKKHSDNHTQALLSLVGLGTKHITNRLHTNDESILYYAGLFSSKVRTTIGLKRLLEHHFQIPVEIKEFIGQWQNLIDDVRTRLPGPSSPGQNHCLSKSVMLGNKGWFAQGKISIVLGPLSRTQLYKFAPGTKTLKALDELVRLYVNFEHDYDFIMRIRKRDVPSRINLSKFQTTILGWNTWLQSNFYLDYQSEDMVDIPVSTRRFR